MNVTDAVTILLWLFLNGPAPPAPFPSCGEDPSPDSLDCGTLTCVP